MTKEQQAELKDFVAGKRAALLVSIRRTSPSALADLVKGSPASRDLVLDIPAERGTIRVTLVSLDEENARFHVYRAESGKDCGTVGDRIHGKLYNSVDADVIELLRQLLPTDAMIELHSRPEIARDRT